MAAKIVLYTLAQVLLMQSISANCGCGRGYNPMNAAFVADAFAADRYAADIYSTERYTADRLASPYSSPCAPFAPYEIPLGYGNAPAASYCSSLPVASSSPIPPNGVTIISENAIEGPLAVSGQLPFLGTVALEGALPTAGSGAVSFGCGNGNVAILSEEQAGYGYAPAYGYEPYGYEAWGYGYDGMRRGCGCARY
ncbi:unnamed protein product [Leptosia nina]|uniref:Uncharacterized protein n=1 Tax=Leptosia nina TaxID=320188 RepID=A0AAV1JJ19_9NEOP